MLLAHPESERAPVHQSRAARQPAGPTVRVAAERLHDPDADAVVAEQDVADPDGHERAG